jgi:hypothetical protein
MLLDKQTLSLLLDLCYNNHSSVDHNLRLKADHNPRLGRWIVIQQEPL